MALGGQFWHPRASGEELVSPLEVVLKQGPRVPDQGTEPTHRPGQLYSSWLGVHLFSPLPVSWCVRTPPPSPPHSCSLILHLDFFLLCFSTWTRKIILGSEKQTVTQVPSDSPEAEPSFSTCSLRAHTHRSLPGTSRRPLAPSSATSPAPAGSGRCSQKQWSSWRIHMQRGADRWWGQSQCQSGGLPSRQLVERKEWGRGIRLYVVAGELTCRCLCRHYDGEPREGPKDRPPRSSHT